MNKNTSPPTIMKKTWSVSPPISERDSLIAIFDGFEYVASVPSDEDSNAERLARAQFIVTAVNSHQKLVEALRGSNEVLSKLAAQYGKGVKAFMANQQQFNRRALLLVEKGQP